MFTIIYWAVAILFFGGGIVICIGNLFSGNGWEKFWAVIAIILAVFAFFRVYAWFESIGWCLFVSGLILGLVGNAGSDEQEKAAKPKSGPSVSEAILDTYCEYELTKAAVKDAIRESKNEH